MSVRERRNRKDRRGKTPEQLRRMFPDIYEPDVYVGRHRMRDQESENAAAGEAGIPGYVRPVGRKWGERGW